MMEARRRRSKIIDGGAGGATECALNQTWFWQRFDVLYFLKNRHNGPKIVKGAYDELIQRNDEFRILASNASLSLIPKEEDQDINKRLRPGRLVHEDPNPVSERDRILLQDFSPPQLIKNSLERVHRREYKVN